MAEYSKYSKLPGDSILALLEPGEYVLNRNAVNAIGEEKLDEINYEEAPRYDMAQRADSGFQMGGMLGDMYGMQTGGSVQYGQAETEMPTFTQLYEQMGIAPKSGTERTKFESMNKYDPSKEQVHFEDYSRSISDATRTSQDKLLNMLMTDQMSSAKSGFAGSGGGAQPSIQRGSIMDDFASNQAAAQSSLFRGVQGERENWMTNAARGLSGLSQNEGTTSFANYSEETHLNAPSNPSLGDTYTARNTEYQWNGNQWEEVPEGQENIDYV